MQSAVQDLILRSVIFVLLLISLIVMVKSKTRSSNDGTTGVVYRFNDFKPFSYVVAADVLGCFFSLIRIIRVLFIASTTKGLWFYFNFIFDQILTFILLSSSSAGIACIMLTEEFNKAAESYDSAAKRFLMFASGSVSMEFLGFIVVAVCALMSGHSLSCYIYSSIFSSSFRFVQRQGFPATATYVDTEQEDGIRNQVSEL